MSRGNFNVRTFLIVLLASLIGINCNAEKIKVACIGDSVTYGSFVENRDKNSYPAQLQEYLGEGYQVRNFGVSGATLMESGDKPYTSTSEYAASLDFAPDIVLIMLGTNDSKGKNRVHISNDFRKHYSSLVNSYRTLPSDPRVILMSPVRCFHDDTLSICEKVIVEDVIPEIENVAYECDVEIVDLHRIFGDRWVWYHQPDKIHPSSVGAGVLAQRMYEYLKVTSGKGKDVVAGFPLKPVREFNFHGYKGYVYDNDGVECYIVRPHRPSDKNHWVWRARFWGYEPQVDIRLLEQGFYLAYCNVAGLFGSPKAVSRWDDFYKLAVKAGLNRKVVLEGISRGGLIIYNWAARNTKKVACIYADVPVMDIKSWPLGAGKSDGSVKSTDAMMKAYGFASTEEILDWKGNPVDHAKIMAKSGIPLLHVVGDADTIVPLEENTGVFLERLSKYGCNPHVITKRGAGHQPSSIYDPKEIVTYILEAVGEGENMCLKPVPGNDYRPAAGWRKGSEWHAVAEDIIKTIDGKDLELLLLGDSITQGFGGNRELVTNKKGKEALDNAIGKDIWESAGISGDRTQNLLWRLKTGDYGRCNPKNVVITIGINNIVGGGDTPENTAAGILECAREARRQMPDARIILFGLLPSGLEKDSDRRVACDRIHSLIASNKIRGVEYIDPTGWFVNEDGSLKKELYARDCLHLNASGYEVWSNEIAKLILKK